MGELQPDCYTSLTAIHRIMIPHIDRDDLLFPDQQFQPDAVQQVDRHRMQAGQAPADRMQPQRRVVGGGLPQLPEKHESP